MNTLTNILPDQHERKCGSSPEAFHALNTGDRCSGLTGVLIVNADDWGFDRETTDRTFECFLAGAVSSVSGMVWMNDSVRAANIAQERGIDTGLHLNLTTPFSSTETPTRLVEHQRRISQHLCRNRFASVVFHPGLRDSFRYVVARQLDEFQRLYKALPERVDGHHHMHLCANVLGDDLLPEGTIVRRNFSFKAGEKSVINRVYRTVVDRKLARRHRITDYFFSLAPIETQRLRRIFAHAAESVVELETHAAKSAEFRFLIGGEFFRSACGLRIATHFEVSKTVGNAIAQHPVTL